MYVNCGKCGDLLTHGDDVEVMGRECGSCGAVAIGTTATYDGGVQCDAIMRGQVYCSDCGSIGEHKGHMGCQYPNEPEGR